MHKIKLQIAGLGIILYSPPSVAHISEGSDYFSEHFSTGDDVARHVTECELTAFCTGSSGDYNIRCFEAAPDNAKVQAADYKLRLGLLVRGGAVCLRDLYDLMDWTASCPAAQQLSLPDGWYRLTVTSSLPASGILGDDQIVDIYFEAVSKKPALRWDGVPQLCDET